MVLSQISNKFHRFQQITKRKCKWKVNVQRKAWRYSDFSRDICVFVYIYVFFFVNKLCEACMSTDQVSKF